jgi:hypothetical protein
VLLTERTSPLLSEIRPHGHAGNPMPRHLRDESRKLKQLIVDLAQDKAEII